MEFLEFLSLPQKHGLLYEISFPSQKQGLSYAISRISISSPKNVDYHMRILEFLSLLQKRAFSKNMDYCMQFMKFHSLLQKRGLSYAVSRISISSPKNVDYHMRILEFLFSLLQKRGLLYEISRISFPFPKTWTIICNF